MTPVRRLVLPVAAMVVVVTLSNVLVQYPLGDWLTWGAFTYPFSFLVGDLTNRFLGTAAARRAAWWGFGAAVLASALLSEPRIAVASGTAFLAAQYADIAIFDRLRRASWWRAPLVSSVLASALDTALFFTLAFVGTDVPWVTLALGDFAVKLAFAAVLLAPYRAAISWVPLRA